MIMKRTIAGIALGSTSLIGIAFLASWVGYHRELVLSVWWGLPTVITGVIMLIIMAITGGAILFDDLY